MWNGVSPTVPTGTVEGNPQGFAGERVGKGGRSKRMPLCNRPDRGSNFALSRRGADFRRVLNHEKGAQRYNLGGSWTTMLLASLKALRAWWNTGPLSIGPKHAATSAEYKPVS